MTHPLDQTLVFPVQLRSDMTTLANVTLKVRKNGGSATTYTNVSSPAITQNSDITYGYELQIPASTYASGDVVEGTWLYSATAYAYDNVTIGPAAYTGADTPGTTTLLTRIASALTITGGKVDVNDKTGFALTSAYDPAKTAAQAGDAMALTSGERTTLTAAMWGALTSGLTAVGSIGKLLVTNVDAPISSISISGVWDALTSSMTTSGSIGKLLADDIPAINAATDLLGTGVVVYGGPVLNATRVELMAGDDYLDVDGRALTWTSTDWPSLTNATVTWAVKEHHGHAVYFPATVESADTVQVELTASDTLELPVGKDVFVLTAVLDDDSHVTLAQGTLIVTEFPS